jgi:ATP/maltotriose-dependent transcriptional regulator MalT
MDELQARAAGWYQENGYVYGAIDARSPTASVLRLLEAQVFPMLFQGEVTTVAAWFDRLPDVYLQTSPIRVLARHGHWP